MWIKWNGGECPVPGNRIVQVRYRSGSTDTDFAKSFYWHHFTTEPHSNIVEYRLVYDTEYNNTELWHEYVKSVLSTPGDVGSPKDLAIRAADVADAMLQEAKNRGRL